MEVEIAEDALAAGAAALSAALTEAMKEGHAKSVGLQQSKLNAFYSELGLGEAMKEMGKGMGGQQ
jgi:DNA-binding protein YbaB